MRVRLSGEALNLGRMARDARMELINTSSTAARITVESSDSAEALPLAYVNPDLPTLRPRFPAFADPGNLRQVFNDT